MNRPKWNGVRKVLCVRLDNMGDVLMSEPAMRALQESFGCEITLLTSASGKLMAKHLTCVSDVIEYNVPWVKNAEHCNDVNFFLTIAKLKNSNFDAAVIFSVFSQNPLPAAMMIWLAGIPRRLAYCRENPYQLLTDWVPEKEPYDFIRHQVKRDIDLVETVGAFTDDDSIRIKNSTSPDVLTSTLALRGFDLRSRLIILHPGVSERKREYPITNWVEIATKLVEAGFDIVITGSKTESGLTEEIAAKSGGISLAGKLSLEEFIALISVANLVISVNTSTIHIAAATQTKIIVLYALTNPQHTPWKGRGIVMPYSVEVAKQSKNEVLTYVNKNFYEDFVGIPTVTEVVECGLRLLKLKNPPMVPELVSTQRVRMQLTEIAEP